MRFLDQRNLKLIDSIKELIYSDKELIHPIWVAATAVCFCETECAGAVRRDKRKSKTGTMGSRGQYVCGG